MSADSSKSGRRLLVTPLTASVLGLVLLAVSWHARAVPAAEPGAPPKEGRPMTDTAETRPFRLAYAQEMGNRPQTLYGIEDGELRSMVEARAQHHRSCQGA